MVIFKYKSAWLPKNVRKKNTISKKKLLKRKKAQKISENPKNGTQKIWAHKKWKEISEPKMKKTSGRF